MSAELRGCDTREVYRILHVDPTQPYGCGVYRSMSSSGGMNTRRHGASPTEPDAAEFNEWVRPSVPYMRRLAVLSTGGHDPDDVVQDALLRAWQRRETYTPQRGSVTSWLLAITADQARRTRRRRRNVSFRADLETFKDHTNVAETETDALPVRLDLRSAVAKLSRRQREAVVLYYYIGLGTVDVSIMMKCTEGTVKSTLADARRRSPPTPTHVGRYQ